MSYILKTNNLIKTYNGKEVVSNVNMNIKKGEIYGFLGPNGAGKTTIMKMMTNLVKPTSGEIEIFGEKLIDTSRYYH
jgi:ABC-2 type transport system ATP-binding protein